MLDPKRTFDGLVARHAPDARTREAVLGNRIYDELSRAVAGSQEYMAAERLYELHTGGGFDLIVLDTPPARNALDFLDAPGRLARFVDSRSLRFFLGAGGAGARIAGATTAPLAAALKRVTGVDLLSDLSEFFSAFGPMAGGFAQRARAVEDLLAARGTTAFVVVTSPSAEAVEEAVAFGEELTRRDLPLAGVVANRVHRRATGDGDAAAFGEVAGDPDLARRLAECAADQRALAERDAASLARLTDAIGALPTIVVPHLRGDVHDIAGLAAVERLLES
jgi:anion-transporting  ArsA/GET3 family ATPase